MAKKMKEELAHREVGSGGSKSVKPDESHDVGKTGYHRSEFGGVEKENYRIHDGYQMKDESPARNEGSNIHEVAHHSVTGELYSGHPERHGHMGKVYSSQAADDGSDEAHSGGGGHEEEL